MYCHYHISEILMYGCNFVGSIEFVCLYFTAMCIGILVSTWPNAHAPIFDSCSFIGV